MQASVSASSKQLPPSVQHASISVREAGREQTPPLLRSINRQIPALSFCNWIWSTGERPSMRSRIQYSQRSIDILFLNAGISSRAPGMTKDGYEIHFGVNYLGHMLLTQLLLPKVLAEIVVDARVVAISSISGMMFRPPGGLAPDKMKSLADDLSAIVRYGHSKYAMMLAMRALSSRYPSLLFTSICPGNVKTDLWNQTDGLGSFTNALLAPLILWLTGISVDEAVRLPMWCATAPRGQGEGKVQAGAFYHPQPGQLKSNVGDGVDVELAEKLMLWTEAEVESE